MRRVRVGDEITIEATELVAGGAAMARVDGLPLFATNVFTGDRALVRITEAKKGFARAELVRIVEPSPLRRAAPCPVAGDCGGCNWTALRLDAQLQAKQRILTESLRRIGKIDPATLPPIAIHPSPLNYRIRSRLHRDGGNVGFFAMRSNRVVPLPHECEVVGVETARRFGSDPVTPLPSGNGTNLGPAGTRGSASAAFGPESGHASARPYKGGEEGRPDVIDEISIWELDGELITTPRELTIRVAGQAFGLATDTFFQVNRHLLATMLDLVARNASRSAEKRKAVDLYSGAGFFTAAFTKIFERVTAVEGSRMTSEYGRHNADQRVKVINAAVEEWVERMPPSDFVFLDPPRSGARKNVIERIAERTGSMICFLACDPVTFARDASRLIASGWRLSTLDLLDLFPNTHHVETLSSFERAS
jgi:23S rRNA (uracil1939-C5)-methyltransferase